MAGSLVRPEASEGMERALVHHQVDQVMTAKRLQSERRPTGSIPARDSRGVNPFTVIPGKLEAPSGDNRPTHRDQSADIGVGDRRQQPMHRCTLRQHSLPSAALLTDQTWGGARTVGRHVATRVLLSLVIGDVSDEHLKAVLADVPGASVPARNARWVRTPELSKREQVRVEGS